MHYRYKAADKHGKLREGDMEALSEADVLAYLSRDNLTPISVRQVTLEKLVLGRFSFEKITDEDKIFLTKYLALMLRVGTDLFRAIDILIEDFEKPLIKEFLFEIKTNLEKGNPFFVTFQNHPEFFSGVVVNLLKAAEESGNLEQTLEGVSAQYAKDADLRNRLKSALAYPIMLLVAASLVIILLVTFVLPRIASIFLVAGTQIPLYSRVVLGIGMFLNKYIIYIAPPVIALFAVGGWFLFKTPRSRQVRNDLLNRIPVVKDLIRKVALARFASTLSLLLKAGIPMVESIDITSRAVGNDDLEAALGRIAREGISRGVSVGDSFRREKIFPHVVTNLMAIGEKAGRLEEILGTLAGFYTNEIDSALKSLVAFVEPVLLIGIGFVVGSIALAVIVPVYQLVSQF